jgi:alpha-ketoglutarate-dependent taurine dioxygenase
MYRACLTNCTLDLLTQRLGRRTQGFLNSVPHLYVNGRAAAQDAQHVDKHLKDSGLLKISLQFEDDDSSYLEQLIQHLHKRHFHGLPITHSALRGWFWDVRPQLGSVVPATQARSETMENFPWHTDCSYEASPPRYFALQVLHADQCGGGTLSILDSARLVQRLSPTTREALCRPEFCITVPPEFIKDQNKKEIIGNVLFVEESGKTQLRFRADIITPLTSRAELGLEELRQILASDEISTAVVNLTPELLPRGSIVVMDNRRWLHARNHVRDPNRHLRRVRWDARPFGSF